MRYSQSGHRIVAEIRRPVGRVTELESLASPRRSDRSTPIVRVAQVALISMKERRR